MEEFLAWKFSYLPCFLILVAPKKRKKMRFFDIKVIAFNEYRYKPCETLFVFDIINNVQQSKSLLSPFNLILSHFEPKISDKMVFLEKFDIFSKFN